MHNWFQGIDYLYTIHETHNCMGVPLPHPPSLYVNSKLKPIMQIKISRLAAILSILAAIITIVIFFTGKITIFDYINSKNNTVKTEKKKPDTTLTKKLKKYEVKTVLVYEPQLIIRKQIDENLWDKTKSRLDKAIKTAESSTSYLSGLILDKVFIENESEFIQSLDVITAQEPYKDFPTAKEEAIKLNADAICSTRITLLIVAQSASGNSALKIIGSALGAAAEKINVSTFIEFGVYHAGTGALIYKDTQKQIIIKDNKTVN